MASRLPPFSSLMLSSYLRSRRGCRTVGRNSCTRNRICTDSPYRTNARRVPPTKQDSVRTELAGRHDEGCARGSFPTVRVALPTLPAPPPPFAYLYISSRLLLSRRFVPARMEKLTPRSCAFADTPTSAKSERSPDARTLRSSSLPTTFLLEPLGMLYTTPSTARERVSSSRLLLPSWVELVEVGDRFGCRQNRSSTQCTTLFFISAAVPCTTKRLARCRACLASQARLASSSLTSLCLSLLTFDTMAKSPREPKPRQKSLDLFRPASTTPRATASASTSSSKHSPRPASNSTNNRQPSTSASTKPSSSKKRKASEPIVLLLSDDDSDLEILELPPAPKTPRLARAMQRDPSTSRAGLDKGKGKAKETEELDMTGVEPDDMAVVEGESAGGSGEDANGSHHVDPSQKIGKEGGRMEEDEEPPMQDDWGEWEDDEHDAASNDDDAGWGEEPKDAIVDDEDEEDEMREEDWESQLQGVVQGSSKDLESITIDDDDDEDEAPVCPICKIVLSSLPESVS